MPTIALIALLLAPTAGSGSAPAEPAAIDAWSPQAAEPEPDPADPDPEPAAATPAPQPMPVPIQPPPAPTSGAQPDGVTPPPATQAPPRPRRRNWPDRPIRWRLDAVAHVGTHTFFDRAWRAFDYDRRQVHLGVTLRADFRLGDGRVFLGGGLSYQRFARSATFYTLNTNIHARDPLAFLRLSIVTVEGVDVFVQAGGGPSIVDLSLGSGSQLAEQRSVGALVEGLGGLALYLPKKWLPRRGSSRVTGGLELGLGYDWRSKITVHPTLQTGEDPIAASSAAFGSLALHRFTWRLGLFIRFQ